MKEQLTIINNNGFFLPFVLFISLIVFSAIITSVKIYQNEIHISNQSLEQLQAESIVQMSKVSFLRDKVYENNNNGNITYTFPSGIAEINYEKTDRKLYILYMDITTEKNTPFRIILRLEVN